MLKNYFTRNSTWLKGGASQGESEHQEVHPPMAAKATALAFEAIDIESCTAILREFFRQHPSASTIKVALSTRDLKPLGARIWQVRDGNFEAASNVIAGFIMTQPRGSVTISARVQ